MACVAALAGVPGWAAARSAGPTADQLAQVGRICQSVVRIRPGEAQYVGCVSSLSDSLQSLEQGRALQQARAACLGKGLGPDSPDWGDCILQSAGAPYPAIKAAAEAEAPGASKSYFSASPREVARREQLACARLGFDPADGAFAGCVANLAGTLFEIDNPQH
jgi:hypothetical protein